MEGERGRPNSSGAAADALLQEAEDRLRQADLRHQRAEQREAAAAELEGAVRASRAELSRREEALALSSAEVYRTACQDDDRDPRRSSGVAPGEQQAASSPAVVGDGGGASLGVSGGGQGWASGMQSLGLGSPIREASSSSRGEGLSWGGEAVGGPDESRDTAAVVAAIRGASVAHGEILDVDARERQLEEWSNALAEQAGAMREQAQRLETAYDRLREKEAELSSSKPAAEEQRGGGQEESKNSAGDGLGLPPPQPRSGSSHTASRGGILDPGGVTAPPFAATAAAVADGNTSSNAGAPGQRPPESRQLEQETVRLAEKAKELDAERRRLRLAAETADREHARAQAEQQEASDARRDAAALRVELERERIRLDAERGGLAAERSLLAAERGRLATERARSRRENEDKAGGGDAAETARRATRPRIEQQGADWAVGSAGAGGSAGEAMDLTGACEGVHVAGANDSAARGGEGAVSEGFGARPESVSSANPPGVAATAGAEQPRPADPLSRPEIGLDTGGSDGEDEAETGSPRTGATSAGTNPVKEPASRAGNVPETAPQPREVVASASPVVRQLSSELVRESGVATATTSASVQDATATRGSREGLTGSIGGSGDFGASEGGRAESVGEQGAVNENDSARASQPERRRRDGDGDGDGHAGPPKSDRRITGASTTLHAGRSREDREAQRASAPPPSIASVRRRLHGGGGSNRRGGRGENGAADSSDDDSSSAATPVRRRPGVPAAGAAAGRSGSRGDSLEPLRSSPRSGSGRGRAVALGHTHRPVPEDPFLAQLHARLAGADHTLRQSLGRREALLSRFGTDGSSVAPTSEGDTSDQNAHSSASVGLSSLDAAASSSSSPADGAERRGTVDTSGGGNEAARNDRGSGSGVESSPETDTRGGRFGYTGRGARGPGGGEIRAPRRAQHGNGGGVKRRQQSRLAPAAVVVPASETLTSVSGAMSPPRGNASEADVFSTPSAVHSVARSAHSGARQGESGAGYRRQAGSDTDDTEAEKENLRELMLALGADDDEHNGAGAGDGGGDGEAGRGRGAGVEESRTERSRDGNVSAATDGEEDAVGDRDAYGDRRQIGRGHEEERNRGGDSGSGAPTGEADAGGGDTLMSSLRAQNEDISSRLQDMSLQVKASQYLASSAC